MLRSNLTNNLSLSPQSTIEHRVNLSSLSLPASPSEQASEGDRGLNNRTFGSGAFRRAGTRAHSLIHGPNERTTHRPTDHVAHNAALSILAPLSPSLPFPLRNGLDGWVCLLAGGRAGRRVAMRRPRGGREGRGEGGQQAAGRQGLHSTPLGSTCLAV